MQQIRLPFQLEQNTFFNSMIQQPSISLIQNLVSFCSKAAFGALLFTIPAKAETTSDSLPALADNKAPQSFEALWSGYDPCLEPLEIEVLKEWEKDGVVMRVVRFRVGIFKGKKSMLAGIYGFPKGGSNLPGILQIHGGGQSASENAVFTNAKRGYATLSLAWAGRIAAAPYMVNHDGVKRFHEGKTDDPNHLLTTDWGAIDAYHNPCRDKETQYGSTKPSPTNLDPVDSPRNSPWFFYALGGRRGLTFLENQPEVDGSKLGVYGHSMGGQQTVAVAATDSRIKAAAPSCGGVSYKLAGNPAAEAAGGDASHLSRIHCPIMFLMPSNDFNGRIEDLQAGLKLLPSKVWRIASAPHHNHQDTPEYEVATQLWFDEHLKGTFKTPPTPAIELTFPNGIPHATIRPAQTPPPIDVQVYYTQQGTPANASGAKERPAYFWRPAQMKNSGNTWSAALPVFDTTRPLWVFANVTYPLERSISGAGYYYRDYTTDRFTISSRMLQVEPPELVAAGVNPTLAPSLTIESFEPGWEKSWFSYRPEEWGRQTLKLGDPQVTAPAGAVLAFDVLCELPNKLAIGIDSTVAEVTLNGNSAWQSVKLKASDFLDVDSSPRKDWAGIKEFRFGQQERLTGRGKDGDKSLVIGGKWQGAPPALRNLRWLPKI